MESASQYIKGECMEMCPQAEISLREKENLLHVLEMVPGTEKHNKPIADRTKMVKCFSRSTAGKQLQDPKSLRPPQVLLKTVNYLLQEVILNTKVLWHITYDFIMDRLRAVRQDMIIQNVSVAESICILQPIVRFYAYSAYRLCNEPVGNFDPYINQTHLQECLKRLLCLYDECNILCDIRTNCNSSYSLNKLNDMRPQFEALYLVLNLGSATALLRALNLPQRLRKGVVELAMVLSLNHYRKNFVRVCCTIRDLPVLLQGVAATHLPEIRKQALEVMSVAYSSKNQTFPLNVLKDMLLYQEVEHAIDDCVHYGLKCYETTVQFVKTDFDSSQPLTKPSHLQFIDKEFNRTKLCDLILIP